MKFVRNLSMLVLLVCVSITLGCTPAESPVGGGIGAGGDAPEAGSGVAGGADMPGTLLPSDLDEPAPATDIPVADEPKSDEPTADESDN